MIMLMPSRQFGSSLSQEQRKLLGDYFTHSIEMREIMVKRLSRRWWGLVPSPVAIWMADGSEFHFSKGNREIFSVELRPFDFFLVGRVLHFDRSTNLLFPFALLFSAVTTALVLCAHGNFARLTVFVVCIYFFVAFLFRPGPSRQDLFFEDLRRELELLKSPLSFLTDEY
jgi:hypothetical protein